MREQKPQTLLIEKNYLILISYDIKQGLLCDHQKKKYPNGCNLHNDTRTAEGIYRVCPTALCSSRGRDDRLDVHFLVLRKLKETYGGII